MDIGVTPLLDIRRKQKAVVDALEDIKAGDISVFNVTHLSSLFDRVVIASADSARQTKALARSVQDKMVTLGEKVIGIEGEGTGEWVLVDLGDIVIHIMQPAIRAHYNLEELWDQPAPRKQRRSTSAAASAEQQHAA
jgi:ribosome-associated protein